LAEDRFYLSFQKQTEGEHKGKYLAVISLGSPQRGDRNITVCDVEIVPTPKAAKKWFSAKMNERPWEPRQ
jgi:hypothetical protein